MSLSRQRRFVTPGPDETLEELAARALPGEPPESAADRIRSWNLHIFALRKPAGLLLVTDWGPPQGPLEGALFYFSQAVDGFDRTADHRAGRLPGMIERAGFGQVERYDRLRTGFGTLDLIAAEPA